MVKEWFKYYCPLIGKSWNIYQNPYYFWWKARKYFKRPKAHLVKGKYNGYLGLPCRTDAYRKGLNFFIRGLGWKDKYNSPRHEWDPIICIVWVNPWKTWQANKFSKETNSKGEAGFYINKQYLFGFVFNWVKSNSPDSNTASMSTWEAILSYTCYDKDIKWCYDNNQWLVGVKDNTTTVTIKDNLTNEARKLL